MSFIIAVVAGLLFIILRNRRNAPPKIKIDDVLEALKAFDYTTNRYYDESTYQLKISEHLRSIFDRSKVNREVPAGGTNQMKIDIDVDEMVGIELKLASKIISSSTERSRVVGQVGQYKKKYDHNVILLVIGTDDEADDIEILHGRKLVEDDLELYYHYHSISKK